MNNLNQAIKAALSDRPGQMPEYRARIMVATPCYTGTVAFACAQSMQVATAFCLFQRVALEWVFDPGCSLVQLSRNWLASELLNRPEFTHLLWLDDDLAFNPDAILKLLDSDKDVVGGSYPERLGGRIHFSPLNLEETGNLRLVDFMPGGFVLVKRHVIEALAKRFEAHENINDGQPRLAVHIFDVLPVDDPKEPGKKVLMCEDYVFCKRVREAGFSIYLRTDITFMHFGRFSWQGNLAQELASGSAAPMGRAIID